MKEICKNCKYLKTLKLMYRDPYIKQIKTGFAYGIQISKTETIDSNCCVRFINDLEAPIYEITNDQDKCENFIPKEEGVNEEN